MSYQQQGFEEGIESEQSQGKQWVLWLGTGLVLLCLIGICLVGGVLLVQQFQDRTEPPPALVMPTSPVATAVSTDIPLAPTATLSQPKPPPTPPIGRGNVVAGQLSAPPVIDGDLSEWWSVTTVESAYIVYTVDGWDGSDDLTAVWRLAWDANNLYIGVEVTDQTHVQTQTGNQIFRGDSLDMQFDTDRAGDYGSGLSLDDFQITFSPGDFAGLPPSAFRFQGTSDGAILDAPGGHHVTVAAQATAKSYNLEAAVPWSDLNLTPSPGLVIGLALNATDNDTLGTAVQEVMKSHIPTRTLTDPTTWGTLTLK